MKSCFPHVRPLGGRGQLTLSHVDAMQVFYGRVLRITEFNAPEKQQQALAILDHYSEGTTYEHCSVGPDSLCKWQRDVSWVTRIYRPPQDPSRTQLCWYVRWPYHFNHFDFTVQSDLIFMKKKICFSFFNGISVMNWFAYEICVYVIKWCHP